MENRIRELAYYKWQAAGCPPGDGSNFWHEAEAEIVEINDKLSKKHCQPKIASKVSKGNYSGGRD